MFELKEVNFLCEFCKGWVGILELEKSMRLMIWLWDDVVPGIVFHKKTIQDEYERENVNFQGSLCSLHEIQTKYRFRSSSSSSGI